MDTERRIKSILVVEPNARLRTSLETSLKQGGYEVTVAGIEGLALVEKKKPDLLLLSCEVSLKGFDGLGFCTAFVQKKLRSAIVMISSKPTKELVVTESQ